MVCWVTVHVLHWQLPADQVAAIQETCGLRPYDALYALREFSFGREELRAAFGDGIVPLVAHAGVHFGAVGMLFNTVFLWSFGGRLESRAGSLRFGLFALLAILTAGVTHLFLVPDDDTPAMGGAGLTAAVIAAYLVWHWRSRVTVMIPVLIVPAFVAIGAPILAIGWFAVQFEPVQQLLTRGSGHPLHYGAIGAAAAMGAVGSVLLYERRSDKKVQKPKRVRKAA